MYYRNRDDHIVISVVHVDDFLLVCNSKAENDTFKQQMIVVRVARHSDKYKR